MKNHFISCDWGSSNLRVSLVDLDTYQCQETVASDQGIIKIAKENPKDKNKAYSKVLEDLIAKLPQGSDDPKPIVLSGMIVSSIGWYELPYQKAPFDLSAASYEFLKKDNYYFLSGLRTEKDVMRGEETQLIGLFQSPELPSHLDTSYIILPGTHSKHVRIQDGQIIDFTTYMSGEIYNLLATESILKHSINSSEIQSHLLESHLLIFAEAVIAGSQSPLAATVFQVRTNQLLEKLSREENAIYLSGLVLGSELSQLKQEQNIIFAAAGNLLYFYQKAAEALGIKATFLNPEWLEKSAMIGQAIFLKNQIQK